MHLTVMYIGFTGRSRTMFKPWISQLKALMQDITSVRLHYRGEKADYYSMQFYYEISRGVPALLGPLVSRLQEGATAHEYLTTNCLDSL